MIDVISYLESKGFAPKHASGSNVNIPCMFCGEDPGKRGRLYISLGPPEEEAGLFFCHLCGTKGNIVTLKRFFGDPIEHQEEEDSAVRSLILEEAARYYHECLTIEALKWLKHERGLTRETIIEHKIGWADGNLYRHLRDQGFATRDIKNTGLIHEDRINGTLVDFLRGVVTIPYHSAGNVVMIRGKEIGGKYLTPPGQKTRLYNSDCTWGAEETVVTEGELDSLVVSQLGFASVGVPGANTWQNNWDDYFIDAKRVYLVFDNDEAGKTGAAKVQSRLGHKARVVEMPEAEPGHPKNDPSEWIGKQGHSRNEFVDLLKSSFGALLISVDAAYDEWKLVQGLPGLKFGYPLLDEVLTPGLLPNQVAVLLAKTNVGKTIMLLNMFQNVCMEQPDARILFVSLEQTRGDWFERALRIFAFHNMDLVDFEKETVEYWRDRLMIVDKNRVTEEQLVTCIDDYEHLTGAKPDLVAVDYLGYWSASFDGKDRYHQVSNAIMSLKAVSKEKMVPIITPHQVNRIAEFGKEPELDAARDSGAVEETADLAMMMWSPDNMKGKPAEEFEYEIHIKIGKTRSGGKGSLIKFQFAPVSLAIVPNTSPLAKLAKRERQFTNENFRQLIYRHRSGVYAGDVDLEALSA
jgi:hypothetical protein